ncbi:hypothetical protein [Pontibacter chinhatensis]|uniref:Uncharacterized protein n=1 Tax=Pontibacter chinhatensis TaxID=1436961 RepID=A0A1I2SBT5_9BACT|nr:hypothetical protein [Pontibacter chinhatensis]SFG50325.1 hypothetical protein SAMN05421739_102715 [Pontibacter chinhatensis]
MSDIIIRSKFSKEETSRRLKQVFSKGNMYDVELQVLHGEYYLTSENQAPVFDKRGLDSLFVQFRIKEDLGQVSVHLTPQTRALSIAMGTMFLTLVWILLFAISMAEKRWLGIEAYGIGIGITLILLLIAKLGRRKEKSVIAKIKEELEPQL